MSYEKQTWANGDLITAEKLNHMEDGIADGGGVMTVGTYNEGSYRYMDKTYKEIFDAIAQGTVVVLVLNYGGSYRQCPIYNIGKDSANNLVVMFADFSGVSQITTNLTVYIADTENDHPKIRED